MSESRTTAYLDGWHAHRKGVDVERNPFPEDRMAFSHMEWKAGWCGRFGAVKLDGELAYDEMWGYSG